MVRILIYILFISTVNYSCSQISFYYDVTQNKITEDSNYFQEGSDLWIGLGVNSIVLNQINLSDTIKLFSSFGCTQYNLTDNSLTLYLWLDYYYGSDCLCAENDDSCKPDTSLCDLMIRFYTTKKGLSCYIGKISISNIDLEKMSILSNYICSESYLNLRKEIYDEVNSNYKKTIDFTYSNLDNYLELLTYLNEKSNKKCLLKLYENVKYILEKEKSDKNNNYLYYEFYSNYANLLIKHLFPMQNKLYSGNKLKRKLKKINLLSIRNEVDNKYSSNP